MSYVLMNGGAFIRINNGDLHTRIAKHAIKKINIRINNTVCLVLADPLQHILIPAGDVVIPYAENINELADIIANWIEECTCAEQAPIPL